MPAQITGSESRTGEIIGLDELVKVDTHGGAAPQSYYRINGLNSIYLSCGRGGDGQPAGIEPGGTGMYE